MERLMTAVDGPGLDLARFPADPRDGLRAWDAADAYLLRHLATAPPRGDVAIVGDRWGALAVALAGHRPVQVADSYCGLRATRENLARNGLPADTVRTVTADDPPPANVDTLLVRVPKSLALLEDRLRRLAPAVHAGTAVVGAGMVKEIHTSTLRLFERILGPTRTSLAEQKARLIHCAPLPPDERADRGPGPWPLTYPLPDDAPVVAGRPVVNHAGVFCADRLDVGTRLLLAHLPHLPGAARVVDLGCGNGVVGLAAALTHPDAAVLAVDESFPAVASARATFAANGVTAEVRATDVLDGVAPGVDLVLCNPPFHSHQATTDATARRMFTAARDVLAPGGELRVVANRHLGHHVRLRRVFGNVTVVASTPRFVVLSSVRRAARPGRPAP